MNFLTILFFCLFVVSFFMNFIQADQIKGYQLYIEELLNQIKEEEEHADKN